MSRLCDYALCRSDNMWILKTDQRISLTHTLLTEVLPLRATSCHVSHLTTLGHHAIGKSNQPTWSNHMHKPWENMTNTCSANPTIVPWPFSCSLSDCNCRRVWARTARQSLPQTPDPQKTWEMIKWLPLFLSH